MKYRLPANVETRPVAVVGAGTLGRRIALMFATQGGEVRIYDSFEPSRVAAGEFIKSQLPAVLAQNPGSVAGSAILTEDLADAVKDAWLVIEAVPEQLDIKLDVFTQLDRIAESDAILATNSSSFASRLLLPSGAATERVLNLHFYMPPDYLTVEMMSSGGTDPEVMTLLKGELPRFGFHPFEAHAESTGFIFNRIWAAIKRESLMVVAEGVASPDEVDAIWRANPNTVGPFRGMDAVGLDVVLDIENNYVTDRPYLPDGPQRLLKEYIDEGRLGMKTGRGFYDDYEGKPSK